MINKSHPTELFISDLPPGSANFITDEEGQVAWDTEGIPDRLVNVQLYFLIVNTFCFLFLLPFGLIQTKMCQWEYIYQPIGSGLNL